MKINRIFPLVLSIFIIPSVFWGCKKEDQSRLQASWSSKDPIAIPFNIRNNQKNLGNVVTNPSFETGKVYYEESNVKSYDIAGWKKVGQNIKWINSNNGEYSNNEVYEGNHAIKIIRIKADETETTGEGIISDFIKVIPGNYSLKLFLKLENICPNQARIGTKMYDAINIRLQYFDKNKIELKGIEFDAFRNKKIDNTFKSLTLSNFWNIDDFGWGEVHGKTANYPFFDGDIPDEARYVKIYIGLKGTGKMWVDNIDFRYTSENFTMLERLKPYFDSSYLVTDLLFPQPKQITRKSSFVFMKKDSAIYPKIIIPKIANKEIKESAYNLKKELISRIKEADTVLSPQIEIISKIDLEEISPQQMIISIGNNVLYQDYNKNLPDSLINMHKNAYYVTQLDEKENLVFINGTDDKAFEYAIKTVIQLFDFNSSTYFGANIIDYPDFYERALMFHYFDGDLNDLKNKLDLFGRFKFNNAYFEWYDAENKDYFPFNSVDELYSKSDLMNYSIMVDLIKLNAKQSLISRKPYNYINYETLMSESLKSLLLAGDYYQAYEECNSDKIVYYSNKNINNNLQFDHIKLLNDFNNYINDKSLPTKLEFLPPWNRLDINDQGQGQAEFYYHDLNRNISDNISMYWTGGTFYSKSIDYAEYHRINNIVGTSPILYDNSLIGNNQRFNSDFIKSYYAGKLRTLSLFEPYNLKAFDDFYKQTNERKILLNTEDLSELNIIGLLTAANYFWNTKSYDPDKSLWIVLNKQFGRDNTIKLIHFNDAYFGLKEICQKIEVNGLQHKNIRIAKNFESDLKMYFNQLKTSLDNKVLLTEIEVLTTDILKKYNNLTSIVK